MKRILLSVVAVAALSLGGLFANKAEAHGPVCYRPRVVCGTGYGVYSTGYAPYGVYRTGPYVPYGVGYSGGWQPYQGFYYQQPRIGLYLGF